MTTPDPIRAALERLIELNDHPDTECAAWNDAIEAARAALAAAPEGEPSDQELYDYWIATSPELGCADPVGFARAVLARWGSPNQEQIGSLLGAAATPPAPVEGEVGELVKWLYRLADERTCNRRRGIRPHPSALTRAATLLLQLAAAAPAVVPVAVSKALIKAECALADVAEGERWCDEGDLLQWAERRCAKALANIRPVMKQHQIRTSEWPPLPAPQGGEVEA